jgi:hypothetical protein
VKNGKLKRFTCEWKTVAWLHRKNEFTENKLLRLSLDDVKRLVHWPNRVIHMP